MQDIIVLTCLLGAIGLLIALSVIDLKHRLLPDRLVLPLASLAIIFHFSLGWRVLLPVEMIAGAVIGAGFLYAIRCAANRIYKTDALGLGDVKLMGAAGLWLGPDGILLALVAGALFGMAHGLGVALYTARKNGTKIDLNRLEVPAGPGFALGIVAMFIYKYGLTLTG